MGHLMHATCLFTFLYLSLGEAQLQYARQKLIYPQTKAEFAYHRVRKGDDTKLVEVQRKGELTKWIETIDGIPVYGTTITTLSDQHGMINRVEGFTSKSAKKVSPNPSLPGAEAVNLLKIYWSHEELDNVHWEIYRSKLYIVLDDQGVNKLVWLASYNVDWKDGTTPKEGYGPVPAYILGLVNAHSGKVEQTWNNLEAAAVKAIIGNNKIGPAKVEINVNEENNLCWHVDEDRRVKVFTMENLRYRSEKTVTSFICDRADNQAWDLYNFTGGYSPRNEAFYHATQFVDLWRELVGSEIQPYRKNGTYLEFYTHFGDKIDNAAFRGFFFTLGDGNETFYPMTCLDIICHEIGHAITKWKGGQLEYWRESGAINEAYSDMLGETCDMYYNKKSDYLIGENIMKPGQGKAVRDMCNPANFGGLDHYKQYNSTVDVHYASGIYNKAWCTLSKTTGWDYIKAFQIFTDANLMFWSQHTTMHCGACCVENAAVDRYLSKRDVREAFRVVGVDCSLCEKSLHSAFVSMYNYKSLHSSSLIDLQSWF